jgi:hypothetical protein
MSSPGSAQFEFNESQNKIIGNLAYHMRGVGVFFFLIGILYMALAILKLLQAWSTRPSAIVEILLVFLVGVIIAAIGAWTRNASFDFRKIVDSKGNDISHLMSALENTGKVFSIVYMYILVLVVIVLVSIVFIIFTNRAGL